MSYLANQTGTVVRLVDARGFGFIRKADGTGDVFFHARDLLPSLVFEDLQVDQPVAFDVVDTDKGPNARNVRPA